MKIEGYKLVYSLSAYDMAMLVIACQEEEADLQTIMGNDAMWHYMTTGQVQQEGQNNGEEGTDQQ